jgi:CRP-like cAMP-binding protein
MTLPNGQGPPNAQVLIGRLHDLPYFHVLNPDQTHALAQQAIHRPFFSGEMLFIHGEASAGLWIVETGRVKIFRVSSDGREHILRIAGPGESFNDIPALDGGLNAASTIALSDGSAWILGPDVLLATIRANPDLAVSAIRVLTARTRELVEQLQELALHSVVSRLARFLLDQHGSETLAAPEVTRSTIALHLATTPESISRALRKLEHLGAIHYDRQTINVLDQELLESVATLGDPVRQA